MIDLKINNCYGRLQACLVAYPCYFDITTPINEKQKQNIGKINRVKAIQQYNNFINTLQKFNVKTYFLDITPECNYQIFTRDIGFVIENILFVSRMKENVRRKETEILKNFADQFHIDGEIYQLENNAEGGDIFVLENTVLVGVSSRTSEKAVEEIREVLMRKEIKKEVVPVYFDISKLHLDCVLGILNEETAIITPFISKDSLNTLKKLFKNLVEIDEENANSLATNFVSIDEKNIIVTNDVMKKLLKNYGFQPIYINYSEFVKAGGSVRCSILPLSRLG